MCENICREILQIFDRNERTGFMKKALAAIVTLAAIMYATSAVAAPRVLVAYFSATGNTKRIAEQIATETGGNLFEITPQKKYTAEDLDYRAPASRCVKEHNDRSIRPAIIRYALNSEEYDVIFVGYPVWWGEAPNILATFLEAYNFSGKVLIPYCSSHSSALGGSDLKLHVFAPNAKWHPGVCFDASATGGDVTRWLKGLKAISSKQ